MSELRRKSYRKIVAIMLSIAILTSYPLQVFAVTTEGPGMPEVPVVVAPADQDVASQPQSQPESPSTDTASQLEEPKHTYIYNADTGRWDSEAWQYNPVTGTYEQPPQSEAAAPAADQVTDKSAAAIDKTVDTKASITNDVASDAKSGDASVIKNTDGGNATSGNAAVDATLLNLVNSTLGADGNQKIAQFTKDINGDVNGDIILNPLLLKAMLEAKAGEGVAGGKTTINSNVDQLINNDINLKATSGNATVADNTTGGSATTGSATAVANVVNVLNSMIAANQSFVGTINIYGNLNGDILIAPDFIPQMIANNGGNPADVEVSSKDTQSIINNISAAATTGAASVLGNTEAGSATSGNATSNVVIFNLSGHQVVAENSLLVFVNVLGKWVGVIVDAPEGATAAMIGNGVSKSTTTPDLVVSADSKQGITNTIAVDAKSGDALVTRNTSAGNAVSGDATALVNVANVTNNQFSMGGWFGVLFINVFNNWFGDFGFDTPYGNQPVNPVIIPQPIGVPAPQPQPIEFRPKVVNANRPTHYVYMNTSTAPAMATTESSPVILASATKTASKSASQPAVLGAATARSTAPRQTEAEHMLAVASSVIILSLSAVGIRRVLE